MYLICILYYICKKIVWKSVFLSLSPHLFPTSPLFLPTSLHLSPSYLHSLTSLSLHTHAQTLFFLFPFSLLPAFPFSLLVLLSLSFSPLVLSFIFSFSTSQLPYFLFLYPIFFSRQILNYRIKINKAYYLMNIGWSSISYNCQIYLLFSLILWKINPNIRSVSGNCYESKKLLQSWHLLCEVYVCIDKR